MAHNCRKGSKAVYPRKQQRRVTVLIVALSRIVQLCVLAHLQRFLKLMSVDKHETCASQPWTYRSIQCLHDMLMLRVKYNCLCVKAYTYIVAENLNKTITFLSWKRGHSKAHTAPTSVGCIGQRKPLCTVYRVWWHFSFLYSMHS